MTTACLNKEMGGSEHGGRKARIAELSLASSNVQLLKKGSFTKADHRGHFI